MNTIKQFVLRHKKIFEYIFCLLVSFVILLFTSKNSFLYQYNDWMDANAFFTVGKSMMNGIVPYRDLFEQKGIFLYLIYGLGYLISNKTFYGVFLLEVISFSIFLKYVMKIVKIFIKEKYSYYIIPILSLIICTSKAFVHGGSAEEFCLPLFAITLYYFFKHFENKKLNFKELFICGFCAGLVLLIKYTLLGFWLGFMAFVALNYFFKKDYKNFILSCVYFLVGMFVPFIISLIYFGINNAISDFFNVYFYINMTAYTRDSSNLIFTLIKGFGGSLFNNGIHVFLLIILLPLFVLKSSMNKETKIGVIVMALVTIFFLYYGLVFYSYYLLPVFIFIIVSLICIFNVIDKYLKNVRLDKILLVIIFICVPIISYVGANYRKEINRDKDEFVQYKYADIINKEDNPTLVNIGSLDMGLYTISDVLPSTYFFELQNIPYDKYPDNIDSFKDYIVNKKTMFILFSTRDDLIEVKDDYPQLFKYYNLIEDDVFHTEGDDYNMFLFKVGDLNEEK